MEFRHIASNKVGVSRRLKLQRRLRRNKGFSRELVRLELDVVTLAAAA